MKGIFQPEIYVLLNKGAKPMELVAIGLNKKTVYNYNARLPDMTMRLIPLEKKLKELRAKEKLKEVR